MTVFIKDPLLQERNILFAWLETTYRDLHCLDAERFYRAADETIEQLREQYNDYDRRTVFSQDPYFRFFRKFKKTCPVMLQFESVLKGRPFPHRNPAAEVPFLFEIRTRMLSGTHDLDCVRGDLRICSAQERETFTGLRGEEVHCYPGDIIGRDDEGIILSMISGADARTCCHDHSTHVFYPVFGTPDMPEETLRDALDLLEQYVHLLDQEARTAKHIL
jgi:DNA/RNA-binding domain of Phe-tRNA-synthetase-like protein